MWEEDLRREDKWSLTTSYRKIPQSEVFQIGTLVGFINGHYHFALILGELSCFPSNIWKIFQTSPTIMRIAGAMMSIIKPSGVLTKWLR